LGVKPFFVELFDNVGETGHQKKIKKTFDIKLTFLKMVARL